MTESNLLQQICEANKSFLAGAPRFLNSDGARFIVLACIDSRLTGLLESALGLPKNRALVVRTAGNLISEASHDALRSIAAGVYLKGGEEIFVVGHTDCALSKFSSAEVVERFRAAEIPRSAFGDEDLRRWFGAFHDPKMNVLQGVEFLRRSPIFPPRVKIHGLLLETESGEAQVLADGNAQDLFAAMAAASTAVLPPSSTPIAVPTVEQENPIAPPPPLPDLPGREATFATSAAVPQKQENASTTPATMVDAVMVFRDVFRRERHNKRFERNISDLRALARRERNPTVILQALEKSVKDYQHEYPSLRAALEFCKRALEKKGAAEFKFTELMKRFLD